MYSPETKYENGPKEDLGGGREYQHISVDQFVYYHDAMEGASKKAVSVVRFDLPQLIANRVITPTIWTLGDGEGDIKVFTQGILPESATRVDPELEANEIWKLFETNSGSWVDRPVIGARGIMKRNFRESMLDHRFTTSISPFINKGSWPYEGQRDVNLYLDQSSYLQLLVERSDDGAKESLTINYLPDERDWQVFEVSRITRQGDFWVAGKAPIQQPLRAQRVKRA